MKAGGAYQLQHSTLLQGDWAAVTSPDIPTISTTAGPITVSVPLGGQKHFYRVSENSPYDPTWASVVPLRTIHITAAAGFAQLAGAIQALVPGDRLLLGAGSYTLTGKLTINLQGTSAAPIRIEAAPGASVVMIRPDALQNMLDIGDSSPARFLAIRGIGFSGGSAGIRLRDCANVWIDGCDIHDTDSSAITANSASTSQLYITRNELSNTGGTAEGVYLGSSESIATSGSVVALNHIHDTPAPSGGSGAAIYIRNGSSGNLVAANHIHDTGGPSIFIVGTAGQPVNTVEGNRCYRSGDNGISIVADCLVRNNLSVVGQTGGNAFRSAPSSGASPTRMTVVNNTFISGASDAASLVSWETGNSMVFANNACYSQSAMALRATTIPTGTTFSGNVGVGTLSTGVTGFQSGNGLADFVNLTWTGTQIDARPAAGSVLRGAASATFAPPVDLEFFPRVAPHATGAYRP
jgi:hypothetical protein